MDGILYDSEEFYYTGNYNQLVKLGYTGPKEALLEGVGGTMDMIVSLYERLLDYKVSKEEILKACTDYYVTENPIHYKEIMFEDIPRTLAFLKEQGLLLACCSSSPYDLIVESVQEMEIESYFDYLISSEDLNEPKPSPAVYLKACEALNLQPSECVVYEDSDVGIASGKNASMIVIARLDHRFGQKQDKADVIVHNAWEMAEWIYKENQYAGNH